MNNIKYDFSDKIEDKKIKTLDKISRCGKDINIFTKDDLYYFSTYQCHLPACPTCGKRIHDERLSSLSYYVSTFNMNYFLTLTSSEYNLKTLESKQKKLFDLIKQISDKDYYYNKNKNGDYCKFVSNTILNECLFIYLYEYKTNCYLNKVNIGIEIHRNINTINEYIDILNLEKKNINTKKLKETKEKAVKYQKFSSYLSIKKNGLGEEFFIDLFYLYELYFKSFCNLEQNKDAIYEIQKIATGKIQSIQNCETLEYIRTLELQQELRPHYHYLLNMYIPYFCLHKIKDSTGYIFKLVELTQDDFKDSVSVAMYILKYITKSIDCELDFLDNLKRLHINKIPRTVTTSKNIKLIVNDDEIIDTENGEDDKFKYYDTLYNRTLLKSTFEPIKFSQLDHFIKNNITIHSNTENPFLLQLYSLNKVYNQRIKNISSQHIAFNDEFTMTEKEIREETNAIKSELKAELKLEYNNLLNVITNIFLKTQLQKFKSPNLLKSDLSFIKNTMLDTEQVDFCNKVFTSDKSFCILFGSAGTGKTTVLKSLISSIDKEEYKNVAIVAPTGKATERLRDVLSAIGLTNIKTIHSLCQAQNSLIPRFKFHDNNKLNYKLIIIDETSMLDKLTLACLLNALKENCKVVFLGDPKQLQPIGTSSPFDGIIKANNTDVITLTQNHRSNTVVNKLAYMFINNVYQKDIIENYDFLKIKFLSENGFLILTNTRKMCKQLNQELTKHKMIPTLLYKYNIGEKVLMLKNNYKKNYFNGSICTIVDFQNNIFSLKNVENSIFTIEISNADTQFQPACALTIHKSQGSEYKCVAIVLDNSVKLLNSNLIYTAITRAKSACKIFKVNEVDESLLYKIQEINEYSDFEDIENTYNIELPSIEAFMN
ncbi:ATP-dependent RecD-like DNA helicase [anaerobic digester metagenome]